MLTISKDYPYGTIDYTLKYLTFKKGTSDKYVNNLIKLEKAGIRVSGFNIPTLRYEDGINEDYVKKLIEKHKKSQKN